MNTTSAVPADYGGHLREEGEALIAHRRFDQAPPVRKTRLGLHEETP